jgi:hypothetical protein
MGGQSVGRHQQGESEQDTEKLHDVTVAFSEFCEIGVPPFLMSVFGLQKCGARNVGHRSTRMKHKWKVEASSG